MPDKPENTINRRSFLNRTASLLAGTALGTTAASYGRIVGANDRISLGHIGIGSRGGELDFIVSRLKEKHNVEMTAVCDLWKANREKAVFANTDLLRQAAATVSVSRGFSAFEGC